MIRCTNLFFLIFAFFVTKIHGQYGADSTTIKEKDILPGKDIQIGNTFIDFETTLLNGDTFKLSEHRGKVILLNFWFLECPPCMGEIPDLNQIYNTYKDSGVVMISLALNSVEKLRKFNEGKISGLQEKIEYPIVPNSQALAVKYGIRGYPTTVLIDKKGIIRTYSGATLKSLKKYIELYGEKGLSKEWKKIAKEYSTINDSEVRDILSDLLSALLNEE
jgi:peroxiredoxin